MIYGNRGVFMKFKKTAIILAMTLVLSACGKTGQADPAPAETGQETQEAQPEETATEPAEPVSEPVVSEPEPEPAPEPAEDEPLTFITDCGTTTINGYTVKPIPDNDAFEFVMGMHGGINLGNAFDASDCTWVANELDYESAWCGYRFAL